MTAPIFAALFPADCLLCATPIRRWTRAPVCRDCLRSPRIELPPHSCAVCAQAIQSIAPDEVEPRCGDCLRDPPPFSRTIVAGVYDGDLRKLIHLIKYERMRPLAPALGRLLGKRVATAGVAVDLVIPVPLHWRRRISREFNQAALLGREVSRVIGVPLNSSSIRRKKATRAQAGLTDRERHENLRAAFRVRSPNEIRGRRVLIVDDVMTTGATLAACAKAVKRAGAEGVAVAALARAHRERLVS